MHSEASTLANAKRKALRYPQAPMTAPAMGPTRKNETSEKPVKTPSAVPRFWMGTRFTASTPSAGNTRENPKPVSAAPHEAIQGDPPLHISSTPADSTDMQTIHTANPPKRLTAWMKSKRAAIKAAPKAVRQ